MKAALEGYLDMVLACNKGTLLGNADVDRRRRPLSRAWVSPARRGQVVGMGGNEGQSMPP